MRDVKLIICTPGLPLSVQHFPIPHFWQTSTIHKIYYILTYQQSSTQLNSSFVTTKWSIDQIAQEITVTMSTRVSIKQNTINTRQSIAYVHKGKRRLPLLPEILDQPAPVGAKSPILNGGYSVYRAVVTRRDRGTVFEQWPYVWQRHGPIMSTLREEKQQCIKFARYWALLQCSQHER